MNRNQFLFFIALVVVLSTASLCLSSGVKLRKQERVGISVSKAEWAKKNFNPQGQIQDRLEVIEKMLGLRDIE